MRAHGIAPGQIVVNALDASVIPIGLGNAITNNATMVILYNTSSGNPTQSEVDKIGERLWAVALKAQKHFELSLDVGVRVNPEDIGPFGNHKNHFERRKVEDQMKGTYLTA